jgi:23S rRNA (adenine2503-C2)-methyltransferase
MVAIRSHPPGHPHPSICDLTPEELRAELRALGQPDYRARQIWRAIYHGLATDYSRLSDLPLELRRHLADRYELSIPETVTEQRSADGSVVKALLRLRDGELIETVLMRYAAADQSRARNTVCISTQAGCAMGCTFCATGQQGFRRNLHPGEIVAQVLHFARLLQPSGDHVTNVVFMGMGEPLANYAATIQAVGVLNDANGFALGARHMTISTVGLIPGIQRLACEPYQVGLALSLHSPDDELRRRLVPTTRRPIREILQACNDYAALTGRRYSVEYALIEGVNDSRELARSLGNLLQGLPCHVNLIPVNPTANQATRRPSRRRVLAFQQVLLEGGINCTVRVEKGVDILAGCGQLRGREDGQTTHESARLESV